MPKRQSELRRIPFPAGSGHSWCPATLSPPPLSLREQLRLHEPKGLRDLNHPSIALPASVKKASCQSHRWVRSDEERLGGMVLLSELPKAEFERGSLSEHVS